VLRNDFSMVSVPSVYLSGCSYKCISKGFTLGAASQLISDEDEERRLESLLFGTPFTEAEGNVEVRVEGDSGGVGGGVSVEEVTVEVLVEGDGGGVGGGGGGGDSGGDGGRRWCR
jgi:hypothetical protein